MLFDSHCHLDDPQLLPRLGTLLQEAEGAGIAAFLVPGVHPSGWQAIHSLSASHPRIFPAYGVHPMHADIVTPSTLSELRRKAASACAIGEIGLDYLLPSPSRQAQRLAFAAQLQVAVEAGLPVLLHCRKAFEDLLAILRGSGVEGTGGVMHAFSGSIETAHACLKLGLHISLSGTVTYANARRPVEVAREVPLERMLLETDAPDLAPEPFRGDINVPAHLIATARRVAEIRGIPLEDLGRHAFDNTVRLLKLAPSLAARPAH
ncbi:TatD family hydrolase [Geomonas subterranea]|uniref:TatD family hydrolase n=1 Tax=Geomonas subterranea TaxID=2847989 RepID=A0ABX8LIT6_9BACT|nr:TatD family hydrolase [Geomonas subterranea]QXE90158.1 TatD family hydrolase [Geomonas subterranea]QXM07716.1 TatD family hydrolase [Geomonas subterranea]